MFANSLDNLRKGTGECKNKHSGKFLKFLKIFGSVWKSSEKIGKCRKVLKTTFQHFYFFLKSLEIVGSLRKKIGKCRKVLKTIFRHFLKFLKIFENLRKCSEMLGKLRKPSEVYKKILYCSNLWHLWTEDQIQEFWFVICTGITVFALVLHFLHWCYSLIALLSANQNRVIFSRILLGKLFVPLRSQ